jgi:protein involved in polysaccharide export with SLBB domain
LLALTFGRHPVIFPIPIRTTMSIRSLVASSARVSSVLGLAWLLVAAPAGAEAQSSIGEMRRQATREELERAAKAAESAALQAPSEKVRTKLQADAQAIRMRLTNGDFIPGDRILLLVHGDTALTDTFTVRGDRMLPLPNIPPIPLQGVLDSELEAHLTKELLKYIKEVTLEATPLVRLSLLGFPQSNFYTVPVDQAITDVIAAAGGWGSASVVAHDKAVIRRNGEVFMDAKATAEAVRQAKTVGDMGLRDGDEFYVPDRASATRDWQKILGVVSALTSVFWLVRWGTRR